VSVKRLGRGLDALIRSDEVKIKDEFGLQKKGIGIISKIKLNLIKPNPDQPRKYFDEVALDELTASISEKGLISPLTVREIKGGYELIAGERRWRALKYLKKRTVPVYVLNTKDESDIIEMALIENLQREDLNAVEEAEAYAVLNKKYNLSHEAIAKAVGKKRVTISNALRLLKLPFDIRKSLIDKKISAGHARAILQAKPTSAMIKVWEVIIKKNLSVRDAEILVKEKKVNLSNNIGKLKNKDPRVIPVENQLIEILGTKVKLKSSKKGGKIEISYYSSDDLDRILDIISN
tara:strand:+ start:1653 stop:2528 length:876 start_codon:yes stop_codon:yes gene_type:complete